MSKPDQSFDPSINGVGALQQIRMSNSHLKKSVDSFQKDMCENVTDGYRTVDQFMWPPISPWEEVSTEEALLAMVNIFDELSFIDKAPNGCYNLNKTAKDRFVFQLGDVATIRKWHGLLWPIVQQYTAIGKEEYTQTIHSVYERFYFVQDYLHENIHRLQGIYKLYYGGLLQLVQVLLG